MNLVCHTFSMTTSNPTEPMERPKIEFTDNYMECYEKVHEFLTYLLETKNQWIDYDVELKLDRVRAELEKAKSEKLPPYLVQLLQRSGHRLAKRLMDELNEVAESCVVLEDKGAAVAQDTEMAFDMARVLGKKPAYIFDTVDDLLKFDSPGVHPAPENSSKIIWVDTLNPVAEGGFGKILTGEGDGLGKVAVKRQKDVNNDRSLRQFQREARLWQQLEHPNVLRLMGVCTIGSVFHIVSPYMPNGNLREFVLNHTNVDRAAFLYEVACALKYIHDKYIIHGDVKAANILVSDTEHALLCDFGLARPEGEDTTSRSREAGSVRWFSPERWKDQRKSFAADIYAF
ncbi:hypothetical protein FRB99_004195, partial [Tulasnella sp. 403]